MSLFEDGWATDEGSLGTYVSAKKRPVSPPGVAADRAQRRPDVPNIELWLARQHSGTVILRSRPGHGTEAVLWLPVGTAPIEATDVEVKSAYWGGRLCLILIVGDEDLVRMSTADELSYQVVEASSVTEALNRIRSGLCCDAVITDHLMPGMTGVDLAAVLPAEYRHVPVPLVLGYADAASIRPESALLSKPFRSNELAVDLASLRCSHPLSTEWGLGYPIARKSRRQYTRRQGLLRLDFGRQMA